MEPLFNNQQLIKAIERKSFEVAFEEGDAACIKTEDALEIVQRIRDRYEEQMQILISSVKTNTFQIESDYYTAGVVFDVETGKCIEAAPILGWMVGRSFEDIKKYVKSKALKMRKV